MKARVLFFATMFGMAAGAGAATEIQVQVQTPQEKSTADRLSEGMMQRLVAEPIELVRSGKLQAGKDSFAALLDLTRKERGADSASVADLLTSFGVGLYMEWMNSKDPAVAGASLEYLAAAVPAYKAAFGPMHPEVAVALSSFADASWEVAPGKIPPDIIGPVFQEALAIRLKSLGTENAETRANRIRLAEFKAFKAKTDPTQYKEAESLLVEALKGARTDSEASPREGAASIRMRLARLYAEQRMGSDAVEQGIQALALSTDWPVLKRCLLLVVHVDEVVDVLERNGLIADARKLQRSVAETGCGIEDTPSGSSS